MDLKLKEVAELLNVSETTIRRWLADGKIPAYKINHQYRFNRSEIEHWVLGQKLGVSVGEESPIEKCASKGGSLQFCLFRALNKGGVLHNVPGSTKEIVIRNTMKRIAKDLQIDADVFSDLLIDRENLHSTALNHGIGIPHTRDTLLNNHFDAVTVVFPSEPIPFGALDGEPAHTLFFLFACDDKRHLHLLAKIAHFSSHPGTLEFLRSKPSKEKLLEHIKEWEGNIQKVST